MDLEQQTTTTSDPFKDSQTATILSQQTSSTGIQQCPCRHPITSFFFLFFKVVALVIYNVFPWFKATQSFVLIFILCALCLSFDFWVTKNISGRILVGLRWWNEIAPDGKNVWRFEAKEDMSGIDPYESKLFWITLYLYPAIWFFNIIIVFIKFDFAYLLVIAFALVLTLSNTIGYTKCKRDAKTKFMSYLGQTIYAGGQKLTSLTLSGQ